MPRRRTVLPLKAARAVVVLLCVVLPLTGAVLCLASQQRTLWAVHASTPSVSGRTDQRFISVSVRARGVVFDQARIIGIGPDAARPSSINARSLPERQPGWAGDLTAPGDLRFNVLGVASRGGVSGGFRMAGSAIVPGAVPSEQRDLLYLPWWLLLGVAAAPGLWMLHRSVIRPARRRARGRCPRCAYDLAGLTPGPCPECGG